ncbi:signal peptide peptidase SppA [Nitrogeniibacter mangrovi]|uniref:Signal peptide peptidase SppA n=1 Tax=Nitrogeniibacter mangrovi TaxID=2016596 RepID=A0A6C1AYM4_9RHOO|nr:signal peptide peptidase SppA [Nitrogeniibacter mangrovi]QID16437.1 signal peptide peptidase SppA [Nitrogeniibacter mangrovi]
MWRIITAPFRFLWAAIDGVRRVLANLLLLIVLVVLVAAWWKERAPVVPAGSALVIAPEGRLVEAATPPSPTDLLQGGRGVAEVVLDDILTAIRRAGTDSRISALVIAPGRLGPAPASKLAAIRDAIADFKRSGKPVYAHAGRFNQAQYYLASAADQIVMAPDGYVLVQGLAAYDAFYKRALDTLGVKVHVFRAGKYKSFVEPYSREGMSTENREMTQGLIDSIWADLKSDMAAARKINESAIDTYVNDYRRQLEAAGGDPAVMAQRAGLVDQLLDDNAWESLLADKVGRNGAGKLRLVDMDAYLAGTHDWIPQQGAGIAVATLEGAIVDGDGPPGTVGGDSVARLLRSMRDDHRIRAVVLRIDSPGGSAFAAEQIRVAVQALRDAGKPVVVSMSSVAASGGYWIATGADEIWAQPMTLTGSIGVFGLFPDLSEPLERIGVDIDGVRTSPLAGAMDPRRPLSDDAREALQLSVEHTYTRFVQRVAAARHMSIADVDALAQGRVWTGAEAKARGLVDQLGGLDQAVAAAARLAGVTDYHRIDATESLPLQLQLLKIVLPEARAIRPTAADAWLSALDAQVRQWASWNDPAHLYAHCLCQPM